MKIAIPVEENNIKSNVCKFFGRTPYFFIYNLEEKGSKFIENDGKNAQGGAGIKSAQCIIDEKVDTLITYQLGSNAIEVLNEANIKIYKVKEEIAEKNIELLIENKLEKII